MSGTSFEIFKWFHAVWVLNVESTFIEPVTQTRWVVHAPTHDYDTGLTLVNLTPTVSPHNKLQLRIEDSDDWFRYSSLHGAWVRITEHDIHAYDVKQHVLSHINTYSTGYAQAPAQPEQTVAKPEGEWDVF